MKTLIIRAASALIAVLGIVAMIYFYDNQGLKMLCILAHVLGVRELTRILFKDDEPKILKVLFAVIAVAIFTFTVRFPEHSLLAFVCLGLVFCCLSTAFERLFSDLPALFSYQAKGLLGFFYVSLLPALAFGILEVTNGKIWFLTLLAITFAGDTFAYLTGMMWGNKKILPRISPKKTIVGSIGGIGGSAVAATLAQVFFLPHISLVSLIFLAVITGVVAQLGDLFESMLKRVANRKDSGSIMPGHGGVLDRLDGVLFGAPIILAGALLLENLF